ncbi:MAG: hypothetical protein LBT71_02780 [Azoarcus sp.]|nr:hypothetical protein [Azoarcus sp.]
MNRLFPALFACTVLAAAGCASRSGASGEEMKDERPHQSVKSRDGSFEGDIWGTPMENSPFGKLRIGMPRTEAEALVGPGSGERTYMTGKAFIPFYFGTDRIRDEVLYKGIGTLTYAGGGMVSNGGKLVSITYDPNESGRRY